MEGMTTRKLGHLQANESLIGNDWMYELQISRPGRQIQTRTYGYLMYVIYRYNVIYIYYTNHSCHVFLDGTPCSRLAPAGIPEQFQRVEWVIAKQVCLPPTRGFANQRLAALGGQLTSVNEWQILRWRGPLESRWKKHLPKPNFPSSFSGLTYVNGWDCTI